jgi:hypothetical protein
MPRLRKYADGNGFYIKDYLYGTGFCTWQIDVQGLAYLRDRGVFGEGDQVSGADRNHLLEKKLIWSLGDGPRPDGPTASVPTSPETKQLASALRHWATTGGVQQLTPILYRQPGDHRDRCFSSAFISWLGRLDAGLTLADLDQLSAPDFDDLANPLLEKLKDEPLHHLFAFNGDTHVLWQLSKVVGFVAQQFRGDRICPEAWKASQPVLHRLFAILEQRDDSTSKDAVGKKKPHARRRLLALRPTLRWEIDFQRVVIVLPEQILPSEIEGVSWSVSPGGCDQPQLWPVEGGRRMDEVCSHALAPSPSYRIVVTLRQGDSGEARTESTLINLVDRLEPCVLFSTSGELLPCEEGEIHPSGEYLALLRAEKRAEFFCRKGIHEAERIPVAPAGWHGWEGWQIQLSAGADIGPYEIHDFDGAASWEPAAPPRSEIIWREATPVWVDSWPRIYLSDPRAFKGAILKVQQEGTSNSGSQLQHLIVGKDIPIVTDDESQRDFLILDGVSPLAGLFGALRLECRLPMCPDQRPLGIRLIRIPSIQFRYVPDPKASDRAMAVELTSAKLRRDSVIPDADTEVCSETDAAIVLRAREPVSSPAVTVRLSEYLATVRIRVPVTRASLITARNGFTGWRLLPIDALDFAEVSVHDRVRVELHEPPFTEDGQLLCRLVGVGEVAAGSSLEELAGLNVFEVDLHRWRDSLGMAAQGTVQVRGRKLWIDLAGLKVLKVLPVAAQHPVSQPVLVLNPRNQIIQELETALESGSLDDVVRLARKCFATARLPGSSPIDRELLSLAAGRALILTAAGPEHFEQGIDFLSDLFNRQDLSEVQLLREIADLRLNSRSPDRILPISRDAIYRLQKALPDSPRKQLLIAEGHYHLARDTQLSASGCWRTCIELSDSYLNCPSTGHDSPERCEARLLRELGRLMLGLETSSRTEKDPASDTAAMAPWIDAVRFASTYIRNILPKRSKLPPTARAVTAAPAPGILRGEDEHLLRLVLAQAGRYDSATEYWKEIESWTPERFFAIRLLRARQAVLDGKTDFARDEYSRLLEETLVKGPNFFLDIIAAERPA